ncbi:MAG: hypothetical protein JW795_13690 [Chitinivibrionales bacterium]|nr:hypothetical protein [Chitinivibrionales bacterium]
MKVFVSITTFMFLGLVLLILSHPSPINAADKGFVEIRKPFAEIYQRLDPKSNIITRAKKSDLYELVYEGSSWYQVKVGEQIGWLEKDAGVVVNNRATTILSVPVGTFLFFILLLVATISGASFLIYKQKAVEI